jgi:hypothetical protein
VAAHGHQEPAVGPNQLADYLAGAFADSQPDRRVRGRGHPCGAPEAHSDRHADPANRADAAVVVAAVAHADAEVAAT